MTSATNALWLMLFVTGIGNLASWMMFAISVWSSRQSLRSATLNQAARILLKRDLLIDGALVAWTLIGLILTAYWLLAAYTMPQQSEAAQAPSIVAGAVALIIMFVSMTVVQVFNFVMKDRQDNELAKSSGRYKVERELVVVERHIPGTISDTLVDGAPYNAPQNSNGNGGNEHGV